MKLEGKICVITGAATGMGRALAVQLAQKERAAGLAICDVNEKDLQETVRLASENGVKCKVLSYLCDVSNKEQVYAWRDKVVADFGHVDLLFNNAGINANGRMVYGPNDDVKKFEAGWDRCFSIDFFGVLYCTRAFLPTLISRPEAYLINTSSVNAFFTWAEHTAYTAAKHAVKGLTDSLLLELKVKAPHVKVALLHPGGVRTNIVNNMLDDDAADKDWGKMMFDQICDLSSEDAADWIVGAVKKDQYRVLVGYDAWCIDMLMRVFPTKAYSFYEQLGKEGFTVDLLEPTRKNQSLLGVGSLTRLMFAGLWTNVLCLSPMVLFKLRHFAFGRALLLAIGVGATAKIGQLVQSKM
ncbi:hypothetical protein BASA81_002668 [Batrachochytrium salamandrivorans]|nr:hypothetical protein BASA81_002668 [Batrachochytrium salamandrivorans]